MQRKNQSDGTEHCWRERERERESIDFCRTGNAQPGKGTPPPVRKNHRLFDSNARSIEWQKGPPACVQAEETGRSCWSIGTNSLSQPSKNDLCHGQAPHSSADASPRVTVRQKTWEMPKIGEPLRCSVTLARLGPKHPFIHLCRQQQRLQARVNSAHSFADAAAILENVFERCTSPGHQACRRSCLLAGFLFDLEKALDTVPRDRLRAAVASTAKLKGLSVVLEAGHAGTCYVIRSCLKRPISKVHVTLGVRQGSVESPLCSILLYALSTTQAKRKRPQHQTVMAMGSRAETTTRLDLSDLCFVDDRVSFLISLAKEPTLQVCRNGVTSA